MNRLAILMPAYNEGERLARTLEELSGIADRASITVILVDDGSHTPIDSAAAAKTLRGAKLVHARHAINLGQGAALETARRIALSLTRGKRANQANLDPRFDAFITMDADGQHAAGSVLALADAIVRGADVALGDRFGGASNVPKSRRVLLGMARTFERWTTGLRLSDAHNGLRAFSPRAIEQMRLRQNRMAHATEITHWIARHPSRRSAAPKLVVVEVPVSVRYTEESLAKGQGMTSALAIIADLVRSFFFGDEAR
ncbi:glycosyltransferase family 2 protein [Pendulispora albinea]|uniref:Glycosyltransferase family 2 protein n=1 Tax=Pendulispora albinea TaxID=2741071 RepID=A0ABZ2LST2_9BACT